MVELVKPARGWSVFASMIGGTRYDVMGPLTADQVVVSLDLFMYAITNGGLSFAASLSSSGQGNAAALDTGLPLVDRSTSVAFSIPSLGFLFAEGQHLHVRLPIGRRVVEGARYVILGATATQTCQWLAGLEVVEEVVVGA